MSRARQRYCAMVKKFSSQSLVWEEPHLKAVSSFSLSMSLSRPKSLALNSFEAIQYASCSTNIAHTYPHAPYPVTPSIPSCTGSDKRRARIRSHHSPCDSLYLGRLQELLLVELLLNYGAHGLQRHPHSEICQQIPARQDQNSKDGKRCRSAQCSQRFHAEVDARTISSHIPHLISFKIPGSLDCTTRSGSSAAAHPGQSSRAQCQSHQCCFC